MYRVTVTREGSVKEYTGVSYNLQGSGWLVLSFPNEGRIFISIKDVIDIEIEKVDNDFS